MDKAVLAGADKVFNTVTDGVDKGLHQVKALGQDIMDSMERPVQAARGQERPDNTPIASDVIYKITANSDLVVPRKVILYPSRFYTFHDMHNNSDKRKWFLNHKCQLVPRDASGITDSRKLVRPRNTWTITATFRGKKDQIHLYLFQLVWPSMWAAKGYSSFTFGFTSMQQAQKWHGLLNGCIEQLKREAAAAPSKRHKGVSAAAAEMYAASTSNSLRHGGVDGDDMEGVKLHQDYGGGSGHVSKHTTAVQLSASGMPSLIARRDGSLIEDASGSRYYEPEVDMERPSMSSMGGHAMMDPTTPLASHHMNVDSSDEEEEYGVDDEQRVRQRQALTERWVPYKQANGLSIYYHMHESDDTSVGGEYMVSAVVHGSPRRVLDVLMHGTTNTTILGPARKMEILECNQLDDSTTKELIRMIIEAPGWAGVFCAPREVVLERMCKTDESKCHVVMFNSSDDLVLKCKAYSCAGARMLGIGPKGTTTSIQARESQEAAEGQRMRRGLWRRPVQCSVSGAYTISCLNHHNLSNSTECLITCMVKVDLKGACAANSWSGVVCDLFGWRDAFLDRILMNVTLVRDEVEQRRFKVQPQDLMHAKSSPIAPQQGQAAEDTAPASANPSVMVGRGRVFNNRSMTMARGLGSSKGARGDSSLAAASAGSGGLSAISAPQGTSSPAPSFAVPTPAGAAAEDAAAAAAAAAATAVPLPGVTEAEEVGEGEAEGGVPLLDYDLMANSSSLPRKYWSAVHTGEAGVDAPFMVRGPTYLKDKKKVPAGNVQFAFAAMDVIEVPYVVEHVARFLPSIRESGMPFGIVINLIIPGNPLLGIVATFATEQHPASVLSNPPADPMEEGHNWQPFDFVMHKFYYGTPAVRNKMLKLIPHIAEGSWMIKSSVGTTPVILGKALKTTYYETPQYIEIDIDISANNVAAYVTGLVRGATKNLVIDLGFVLEGVTPWELPENLLGTLRLHHLDLKEARKIDVSKELPLVPPRFLATDEPMSGDGEGQAPGSYHGPSSNLSGGAAGRRGSQEGVLYHSAEGQLGVPQAHTPPHSVEGGEGIAAHTARRTQLPSGVTTVPGSPSTNTQQLLPSVSSGNVPTTTFGMRHRGHARTASQSDSTTSSMLGMSALS